MYNEHMLYKKKIWYFESVGKALHPKQWSGKVQILYKTGVFPHNSHHVSHSYIQVHISYISGMILTKE